MRKAKKCVCFCNKKISVIITFHLELSEILLYYSNIIPDDQQADIPVA